MLVDLILFSFRKHLFWQLYYVNGLTLIGHLSVKGSLHFQEVYGLCLIYLLSNYGNIISAVIFSIFVVQN